MKQFLKEQLNALLNVGFASRAETAGFGEVGHDDYVEGLQQYLNDYGQNWAERPSLANVQGLNDRGIDLIAEFSTANYAVGFQVKSYNDISAQVFSQRLWQQIGQSGSYDVDRLYIILCGDMTNPSHYQKVRHFVAEIERGNYPQIIVIQPDQAWQLFQSFAKAIDPIQVNERMNRHIARFLQDIGRSQELNNQYSLYRNLEELYVPPADYADIRQVLDEHGIVFIIGAPHLGKTFTAVKLLYDLFVDGYQPIWLLGRITSDHVQSISLQEVYRRHDIQDTFSLEAFIRPGYALYLEDPFGRTDLTDLEVANSLLKIQELLHILERRSGGDVMEPRVIISSREGIFRHAVESQPELAEYAVWLRAGMDDSDDLTVSYNFESRVAIIERYLHLYLPSWAEPSKESSTDDRERIGEVLSYATSLLWTPHGIQRFVNTTQDLPLNNTDDLASLKERAHQAENISDSFADEIALLPPLHQLVFVSIFFANYRKTAEDFLRDRTDYRNQYLALVQALGYAVEESEENWQTTLEEYPSIIEQIQRAERNESNSLIRFAHPAYGAAVSRFLSHHPSILDSVFAHVQLLLQTQAGTRLARDLVQLLPHWHHRSPSTEARVLTAYLTANDFQLVKNLAEQYALRYAFTRNEDLREAIRGIVWHPLAQGNNNLIRQIFVNTAHHSTNVPIEARCAILLVGIDDNPHLMSMGMYRPYDLVCRHYGEVTDEARAHLHQYLEDSNARQVVGRSLGHYYDLLPEELRKVADSISQDDRFSSFLDQKELIDGLILGFGKYNREARDLIQVMANSHDVKTRAYLASALVPIYEQLDDELRRVWHDLVNEEIPNCVVAVAERIISLSAEQPRHNELLEENGLRDLALSWTRSNLPTIRAELLRLLLEYSERLPVDDAQARIEGLLYDNSEIVRATALYWMLRKPELQDKFPKRFEELMEDISPYSHLSKIVFYTNARNEVHTDIEEQVKDLQNSESQLVRNALLFHISAQEPFLPDYWSHWLEEQGETDSDIAGIIALGRQRHLGDEGSRPIFEPNWLIDYEEPLQLIWLYPPKSYVTLPSSGFEVIVKKVDELNLILHIKSQDPHYLEC